MAIPVTQRELKRAWRSLTQTWNTLNALPQQNIEGNAHRLILFYAVECGLKVVWLKNNGRSLYSKEFVSDFGHNLIKIQKALYIGVDYLLPEEVRLPSVKDHFRKEKQRQGSMEVVHQAWRYGISCQNPNDEECERRLLTVLVWINDRIMR